ncbi:hypothetical protein N7453_011469 [Penicillium expansum]|nr:hypothetical protein N7453_011469 [Penicillium expansum]
MRTDGILVNLLAQDALNGRLGHDTSHCFLDKGNHGGVCRASAGHNCSGSVDMQCTDKTANDCHYIPPNGYSASFNRSNFQPVDSNPLRRC